jgi:hypothetical protein
MPRPSPGPLGENGRSFQARLRELFLGSYVSIPEADMRTHISNLSLGTWLLLGLPALVVCRSVVMTVIPCVVHAVVPQVVRTVLSVI